MRPALTGPARTIGAIEIFNPFTEAAGCGASIA